MCNTSLLSDCLREQFPEFNTKFGLTRIDERYDVEHFGNALLVLENREVCFRFVRDRGQFFAEVGAPGEGREWWDLLLVAELAGDPRIGKWNAAALSLGDLVAAIEQNYSEIIALFSPNQLHATQQELTDARQQRFERHWGTGFATQIEA